MQSGSELLLAKKELTPEQEQLIEQVKGHFGAVIDILNKMSQEGKEATLDDVRAAVNAVVTASMWSARALSN